MKSWTVTRVIMWHLCQHGIEASKDWVSVAHFNHLFNTPMPRTVTDVPRSPYVTLLKQAGWYPWAVRLWICGRGPIVYSKCHACMPVYKCTYPCTTHSKPQSTGKPNRCGSVLLDRKDPTCFSILQKKNNSKYLNFKFNAMQFLDIWKCIKRYRNATLSITPRKSKTFCCCHRHYFSSHDQHVWSWTHDHTPANPTISHPGMI